MKAKKTKECITIQMSNTEFGLIRFALGDYLKKMEGNNPISELIVNLVSELNTKDSECLEREDGDRILK